MKTKNEDLLKEVIETINMLDYYENKAEKLLEKLREVTLTRTEIAKYSSKKDLIDELESYTY